SPSPAETSTVCGSRARRLIVGAVLSLSAPVSAAAGDASTAAAAAVSATIVDRVMLRDIQVLRTPSVPRANSPHTMYPILHANLTLRSVEFGEICARRGAARLGSLGSLGSARRGAARRGAARRGAARLGELIVCTYARRQAGTCTR